MAKRDPFETAMKQALREQQRQGPKVDNPFAPGAKQPRDNGSRDRGELEQAKRERNGK